MPNSLTRQAGLKLGPLFLETLVKHYLDRIRKSAGASAIPLRQDELLYDEVFIIVKVSYFELEWHADPFVRSRFTSRMSHYTRTGAYTQVL